MDRIQELLARLREPGDNPLSNDELAELTTLCRDRARELRGEATITQEVVTELTTLRDAVTEAATEQTTRDEAQATLDAAAADALAAIDPEPDPVVAEVTDPADPAAVTDPAADPADPAAAAVTDPATPAADPAAPVTEPLAASATPARPAPRAAAAFIPAARRATPAADEDTSRARVRLVASSEIPGVAQGSEITSMDQLGAAVTERLRTLHNGRAMVASLITEYPEDRDLRGLSPQEAGDRIDAVVNPRTLVATGGICSPVAVDYSLLNISVGDRPLKAGLPGFQADRGGLVFVTPPVISGLAGATSIWTEATDASPGGDTKDVLTVTCGATQTVYVDAIPTRLRFGNMQARFFPEQVATNTALALAAGARKAETKLWDAIRAASTIATAPKYLGATRNLLSTLDLACAAYRDRHRTSDGVKLRIIIHRAWRDAIRSDMAREIGHAQTGEFNSLAISDAQIDAWFAARGVSPIWVMDSLTAGTFSGVVTPAQSFGAQGAGSALTTWPTKCVFTLYAEGSYQFLDGGRLDLGVVRDSTLDDTNDYETFIEPFENVAFRGVEADTVVATVAPDGGSAGTVTPAEPSE